MVSVDKVGRAETLGFAGGEWMTDPGVLRRRLGGGDLEGGGGLGWGGGGTGGG